MARNWEHDRDTRDRGRDRGGSGYRPDDGYRPHALSPRSPYHDSEPRRRYSPRSPPYTRPTRDSRSRSPRPRDRSRGRRDSAGPARLPPGAPALLGRLEPAPSRIGFRPAEAFPQRGDRPTSRTDPKEDHRPRSAISAVPRPPADGGAGKSALDGPSQPQGEASSTRSEHNVSKSLSVAPSPRSPVKQDQTSKSSISGNDSIAIRPNTTNTTSAANAQITTSSGAATPMGSIPSPSRRPSTSAAPASKSASMAKKTAGTASKRSESRSGRPANRAKDAATRSEQEDRSGNATRTGGSHSTKDKGKATVYNPRVDPAVLNLVKANFALYNAEAMVDKYRLESLELEKAIDVPVKDMSPEDQRQLRQLITEFGQHRDSAKKERDSVIISFEKALHPFLSGYLDGMLKDMLPVHLANAKLKAERPNTSDTAAVGTSNQMDTGGNEPRPWFLSASETEAKSAAQPGTEMQDRLLSSHDPATATSGEPQGETLQTEGAAQKSAVEIAEAREIDHALNTSGTSAPMEVDVDKPSNPLTVQPVGHPNNLEAPSLPVPDYAPAALSNGTAIPPADGLVTQNKQDRRKLVGERLKILEDSLRSTSTTTDELGVKLERLEEQIANQEEQLYEYLNTQALSSEGQAEDSVAQPDPTDKPSSEVATKHAVVEPPVSASKIEEAVLETARAALEIRLAELARVQDTRIAAITQANEARLSTLRNEIRAEISVEAARAEEAYAAAIQSAEEKASKLESQLATMQAELSAFKEDRKAIEELKVQQQTSDQLLKTIRESTLKAQLTENQGRASFNTKIGEIETRIDSHDAQLRDVSTFEQTKEAWRNDMIDMKNHVIGRVDYLEEQVETLKTPDVSAGTNAQPTQPSAPPQAEQPSALQRSRENSAVRSQAQTTTQATIQPVQTVQPRTNQMPPQHTSFSGSQQSITQMVNPNDRSQHPMQSTVTSSGDVSQARLALNRTNGPSVLNPAPVTQSAASPVHPAFQSSAGGLSGYTAGISNASAQNLQTFGQSWQPARSIQQSQGQGRLSPLHIENEQGTYPPRSLPVIGRSASSGSPMSNANPAPEGSLSSRLNGGDTRSPVPRPDSTPASTLPLVMRMHNGNGLQNSHSWMQMNSQPNSAGVHLSNGAAAQSSSNEGSSNGGRLRMYVPGDTKPAQL